MTTPKKIEKINKLLSELYELTDFEGILTHSLEGGFITSSDIIHMADVYEPPCDPKDYDDERIIATIDESLKKIVDNISLLKYISWQQLIKPYLPDIESIMNVIKKYYENRDILDTFENEELFDIVQNSLEMDEHDEQIKNEAIAEFENECDCSECEYYINCETDTEILKKMDASPDELWKLFAEYGNCGNYDYDGIRKSVFEIIKKLNCSSYNKFKEKETKESLFCDILKSGSCE